MIVTDGTPVRLHSCHCMQERHFLLRTCIAMVLQTDTQQHFATPTQFELRKAVVRDWGSRVNKQNHAMPK